MRTSVQASTPRSGRVVPQERAGAGSGSEGSLRGLFGRGEGTGDGFKRAEPQRSGREVARTSRVLTPADRLDLRSPKPMSRGV